MFISQIGQEKMYPYLRGLTISVHENSFDHGLHQIVVCARRRGVRTTCVRPITNSKEKTAKRVDMIILRCLLPKYTLLTGAMSKTIPSNQSSVSWNLPTKGFLLISRTQRVELDFRASSRDRVPSLDKPHFCRSKARKTMQKTTVNSTINKEVLI
jgi:hypothetical protein